MTGQHVVRLAVGLTVAGSIMGAAPAAAQTLVTPGDMQGWASVSNTGGSSSGITGTAPYMGDGSIQLNAPNGGGTRFQRSNNCALWSCSPLGYLDQLTAVSFDWMVSSASTVGAIQAPSFRLLVGMPTGFLGTYQTSELIWEAAYNGYGAVTRDQWTVTNVFEEVMWRRANGANTIENGALATRTAAGWAASNYYDQRAVVYGISVGFGSGVAGSFTGFADNITLGFQNSTTNWQFNLTDAPPVTVPEPLSMILMGTGLVGIAAVRRRRALA